jgi:Cu2+-exporting ATPase
LIALIFGTAVFLYGGLPFVQGALRELRDRLPGMMTLIALAISVAFVFSVMVTLGYPAMPLWEELATLITIMLLGWSVTRRAPSPNVAEQRVRIVRDVSGASAWRRCRSRR